MISPTHNEAENVPRLVQDVDNVLSGIDYECKMSPSRAVPVQSAIVVPCYNESARLGVAEFQNFLDSAQRNCVLIFVDDGSRDHTAAVLERIRKGHEERVVVLQ